MSKQLEGSRPLREIRFSFDWGHQWPLWETGFAARYPEQLGLSVALQEQMLELQRFWETYYLPETGWDLSAQQEAVFLRRAAIVALSLQLEIADWGRVVFAV
jgi:hypothetical protein